MSDKLRGYPLTLGVRPFIPFRDRVNWWGLAPFDQVTYQHGYDNGSFTLLGIHPDDHMRPAVADLQRRG